MGIRKFVIVSLLVILLTDTFFCQENFQRGYIITQSGDTARGYIDYRNWSKNPLSIAFKLNTEDTVITARYMPHQIRKFSVAGEMYESAQVEIDISPYKVEEIDFSSEYKMKQVNAFLLVLIEGEKSLYYLKDEFGKEHYMIMQDTVFKSLLMKKYLVIVAEKQHLLLDERYFMITNEKYKSQLHEYFIDCPFLQKKINDTEYKTKSLVELFEDYYRCVNLPVLYQKPAEKLIAGFGLLAGLSFTKLKFSGEETALTLVSDNYPLSFYPTIALYFNLILTRTLKKWSICNELLYSNYKVKGINEEYISQNQYSITNSTIGYSYIKLNNIFRYSFTFKNKSLFVNCGLSKGLAISETNYANQRQVYYTIEHIYDKQAVSYVRIHEEGLIFGLGCKHKNYSLELRYERGNGMSDVIGLNSTVNRFFLLGGYRFY